MFDKVDKLFNTVTGPDKAELALLNNACIDRMNAYQKSPTAILKKDWDAAKEGLKECIDHLWPKYFPEEAALAAEPQFFDKQKEALAYVLAKGYKCSAGKFSNDWNNGKVKVHQGRVALGALMAYAVTLDVDHKKIATSEQRQARKENLEIRKLEMDIQSREIANRKEDARWVLKEDSEAHEAALVGILRDTFRHRIYLDHTALLNAAGGDPGREAEFTIALRDFIDAAFNEVADGRQFEVEFEDEEEDDA